MNGLDGSPAGAGDRARGGAKKLLVAVAVLALVACALLFALIAMLQRWDEATIAIAKEVDAFIVDYCEGNDRLPAAATLASRFPTLNRDSGWFFYTDDRTFLTVQYPMRWSNEQAIGRPKTSEFTATVYAYTVEYRCDPDATPTDAHAGARPQAGR